MKKEIIKYLFIYGMGGCLILSCVDIKRTSLDAYRGGTPLIQRYFQRQPYSKEQIAAYKNFYWYKSLTDQDKRINDDILTTIFSSQCNMRKNSNAAYVLLHGFTGVNLYLDTDFEILNLPSSYKDYLPFNPDSVKLRYKEASRTYNRLKYNTSKSLYNNKRDLRKSRYCYDYNKFNIKSYHFPNKFYFPIDLISPKSLCGKKDITWFPEEKRDDYSIYDKKKLYLVLDLPFEISYLLCKADREAYSKQATQKYNKSEKQNLFESCQSVYSVLQKTNLLFEPSFSTFSDNAKYLWDLYLIKLRFGVLGDTIFNRGLSEDLLNGVYNYGFLVDPIQPRFQNQLKTVENIDLSYIPQIHDYLQKDLNSNQNLYKSYFELVLWPMYKCSQFTIHKKENEKASFIFTSNNPKYPGNYEVFFSIYEPNEFKVKKRK